MNLTIAKTRFQFSFFSITLYLMLMILLVSLGFWQLDRAEQKKDYFKKQQLAANKVILQLTADIDMEKSQYSKTEITGHFESAKQYLIDNQMVNGQAGYFVMTPFKIDGAYNSVLVNRGWVKLNKDRRVLPDIAINDTTRTIKGRINHFPVVAYRLAGAEIPTNGWPSVVQVVDIKILSDKIGYPLLPFQIEMDKTMSGGYSRDWRNKHIMPPEKHIAYAVQWFGLAITLTILFIVFNRKK
ncbi:MAG: SURF1 family protein [Methylococcales bacterium]